ncbi:unnamed protein product [Schistosoma mattheei]|uniref:Uncharacterized protein n=1 Tax=Schistosoma mattheei TaxID=31246 RepID=A0A183NP24_9TREM|nr:unnamed protein product [Schistosoma mattheei]
MCNDILDECYEKDILDKETSSLLSVSEKESPEERV